MPLKLQILSIQGVKWVGWCKNRLVALALMRKPGQIFKKTYALPDGIFAQIILSDICDIIRIWGGAAGFISHPRTTLHPFGVNAKGDDLLLLSDFPLVDDDHGSAIIDLKGKAEWTDAENYGNMAFVSGEDILSWRGPSGGYVLNNPDIRVQGFTEQFRDFPLYTPLSKKLYQAGEVLEDLAGNVRCAAIIAGVQWVVVEVDGIDQLCIKQDGEWVVIASRTAELFLGTAIPCVFQNDKVILQTGEWSLSGDWTAYQKSEGETRRGSGWDVVKTVSGIILQPGVNAAFYSTDKTVVVDDWDKTTGLVQAYIVAGDPLTLSGPDAPSNGSQYVGAGGRGPYTWTISDGDIGPSGIVSNINSLCGPGSITVTDSCGDTASKTVRWPTGGSWQSSDGQLPSTPDPWNHTTGGAYYNESATLRFIHISSLDGGVVTSCNNNPPSLHPSTCQDKGFDGCGVSPGAPPYNTWTFLGGGGGGIYQWVSSYVDVPYQYGGICWVTRSGDTYYYHTYGIQVWVC